MWPRQKGQHVSPENKQRMWLQVGGRASFPSSGAPLPHGMGGKGHGARSCTSSPFTVGIPEHLAFQPSTGSWHVISPQPPLVTCSQFHTVQEHGQPPFPVPSIPELQCLYSLCLSEKAGMS